MSPASQQKRKRLAQYERSSSIRKLSKFEQSKVVLNEEQDEEMHAVMDAIQDDELEKLFQEGNQHGVGSLMKTIWFTDKERQKKRILSEWYGTRVLALYYFNHAELNAGRGNRWSMITMRMGMLKLKILC